MYSLKCVNTEYVTCRVFSTRRTCFFFFWGGGGGQDQVVQFIRRNLSVYLCNDLSLRYYIGFALPMFYEKKTARRIFYDFVFEVGTESSTAVPQQVNEMIEDHCNHKPAGM